MNKWLVLRIIGSLCIGMTLNILLSIQSWTGALILLIGFAVCLLGVTGELSEK